MENSGQSSPDSSGHGTALTLTEMVKKWDDEKSEHDLSEIDRVYNEVSDPDTEISETELKRHRAIFDIIRRQLSFERMRKAPVFNFIGKEEKKEFNYFKIRSMHKFKIAGVLHRESRTGDLHSTFGVIAYDNRLLYTTDDGQEHTKIIRNKTKHFNRKREYETVFECDDLLPYTLTYGKEYPSTIQNLLLNIAHSVTMLSKEFMTREIAEFTKKNQRVIILTGIVCTIFGLIIGLMMGQVFHI